MNDFLFIIIELFSLALTIEALQGKTCQDSLLSGGGRSLGAKISRGRGCPCGIFFGFYKTRHILLSDSANCTVLRSIVLAQYRRVTDRRTEMPQLAKRLRRAVKNDCGNNKTQRTTRLKKQHVLTKKNIKNLMQ